MAKIQAAEMAIGLSEKEEFLPTDITKTVDLTKSKQKENQRNYSSRESCFRCGKKYAEGHNTLCRVEHVINVTRRIIYLNIVKVTT